jgi:hypothetical protein
LPQRVRAQRSHAAGVDAYKGGSEREVKRNAGCSQTLVMVTVRLGRSTGAAKADAADANAAAAANFAFLEDARVGDSAGVRFFTPPLPPSVPSIISL